ncbi:hypothetical protein PQU95_10260 [Vogesella sp. DC21W]|uniref:Uncharacterized protein n=1 Tax=Vogesella aquatica TaxID=2984206 RepID=A0ABT5IYD9_9NEIS|nr:hypothetical protein [Vogesella aquatica]MDC7717593.1 hypothetical protein [Vogesella aquatica]
MNDKHHNADKLKHYNDMAREQHEEGNSIDELEAVERMRMIREKNKERHDCDVDFDN